MATFERTLRVFPEVLVYQPGTRPSADGYKAGAWNENNFLTKGRLTVVAQGDTAFLRIEDEHTDELFAECPVNTENFSKAVERVLDSSRYYVIRVVHEDKCAYLGMGFRERSDSFDFMACLQDHIKHSRDPAAVATTMSNSNFSLKDGEELAISIPGRSRSKSLVNEDEDLLSSNAPPKTKSRSGSVEQVERKITVDASTSWEQF
ncbi:hypothetical protein RCL1_002524 [Eukaryota sp. TZLM3-RCL]